MIYFDSSAALKVVVREAESRAMIRWLAQLEDRLISSWLVHSELHCAAARRPRDIDRAAVEDLLAGLVLVDLTRGDLLAAPSVGGGLRTLDALHLATAVRVEAHAMVTYDVALADAARGAGLAVIQPS